MSDDRTAHFVTDILTHPIRSDTRDVFVVSAERPVTEPEAFLRAHPDAPRGFWAHRGTWSAFAGAVTTVSVMPGDVPAGLRAAAGRWRPVGPAADTALRFYGGVSFAGSDPADSLWRAFGAGRFVLPALELRGGADSCRLTARAATRHRRAMAEREARQRLEGRPEPPQRPAPTPVGEPTITDLPRAWWDDGVAAAMQAVADGQVKKVVLSRYQDVEMASDVDPLLVLRRIREENPHSTVFYFEFAPGCVFLGAAPEILAQVEGDVFTTTAVAGSTARGVGPQEDDRLAATLLASPKERREHAIGVDDLRRRLTPLARMIEAEGEPHVLRLARIQHLETHIRARLQPAADALDAMATLHPSAAVCGHPREAAREFLARHEPFDRGWYAGPIGWFDLAGNGVFAPALRSAVAEGRLWRLFAGAGIVTGSIAEREWLETAMKLEPVRRALGVSPSR